MDITAGTALPERPRSQFVRGRHIAWTPGDVWLATALLVAALFVPAILLGVPAALAWGQNSRSALLFALAGTAISSILMAVIAVRFSVIKYRLSFADLGFGGVRWSYFGWAAAALVAAFAVGIVYQYVVDAFDIGFLQQQECDQIPSEIHNDHLLLAVTAVYAITLAPISEEMFFRGFALQGLWRAWGVVAGIVVSALLFGGLHVIGNPELYKSMIPLSAVGAIFAFVFYRTGSIVPSMSAHFAFNLVGSLALFATTCPK
jgi:membrane protease YdiL (CAAX protease family)